jgi:hypothetical protein
LIEISDAAGNATFALDQKNVTGSKSVRRAVESFRVNGSQW